MPKNNKSLLNLMNNIPMPSSINYNWNLGSLLGMMLMIQILTGLLISFHYISSAEEAFNSVSHISRDTNKGYLFRLLHINGASTFFIFLYMHISKNIMNNSFKLKTTWNLGTIIILMLMMTAFMGYVLPWGQMSFWAATVITNLLSAIPIWGNTLTKWIWGNFSVSSPTLTRFYSIHFITPFLISMLSLTHIISLHSTGSSNPINIQMSKDKINFHPFFTSKDMITIMIALMFIFMTISINPFISMDPENFIPANPLVTPTHIQPEWYFLFAYSILRAIPNKLGGVLALMMSILILSLKTIQNSKKTSFKFNKSILIKFTLLMHTFSILTWIGMKQVEYPFDKLAMLYSTIYFSTMIFL